MTTPLPTYTKHSYYSGPVHGWITFYQEDATGVCWWLNGNQWRYWDNTSGQWVFAHLRSRKAHGNTWAGSFIGLIVLIAGAVMGGPALPVCACFAAVCVLLGLANTHVQNHHPQAYQAVVVASAAYGAYGLYEMGKRVHRTLED